MSRVHLGSEGSTSGPTPVGRRLRARMAARLDAQERAIINLRFGLEGNKPLPLKEVARQLGVTNDQIRVIEIRAVSALHDGKEDIARPTKTGLKREYNAKPKAGNQASPAPNPSP